MVPDKFNMVDMGGIDLIMMQGEAVPGLYDKLMEATSNCRYQCLYNWIFDGVLIPPTYVQIEVEDDEVFLNEGVSVTSDDVIHIYSLEPPAPEIIPLLVEENGEYNVPAGKDGFNPVTVDVPSYTPVINSITITENGIYDAPSGVDGYSPVTVNVPVGSDVIVSQVPPSSDVGTEGQYYIYEEQSLSVKYGIQIITAARGTSYSFGYWGVRDIDFVFTDGITDYHLRDFSNAHCYWASGNSGSFTQQDSNIAGQTGSYKEHDGLPGWYEISATVPAGLLLSKVRICGRNDSWGDFWRTFKIGQWIDRRNFLNTLINEQDLVLSDWNTSSTSAYTEFSLSTPMSPIGSIIPHLYQKTNGIWVQYS